MKRRKKTRRGVALLWTVILLIALLAGCGSNATGSLNTEESAGGNGFDSQLAGESSSEAAGSEGEDAAKVPSRADGVKLICTGELELETTEFDTAAGKLRSLAKQCGGYFEEANVTNNASGYRHARYVVRVPAEKFEDFYAQAGTLCHVTYQASSAQDVSEDYYDTAGRLETQKTKLTRLQALLAQANTMDTIITLEDAISQTEEQIELLSGTLRSYDSQVNYASVSIALDEVYHLSNVEEPAEGFGGRLASALGTGWRGFVTGIQGIILILAYCWVWLVIAAAIVVLVVWLHRRQTRQRKGAGKTPQPDKSAPKDTK